MTIDETIEMYKKIANTDSNCPRYCMNPCEDCVKECKQVAEWLEELKRRREYDGEIIGSGTLNNEYNQGYNKALDDIVTIIKERVGMDWEWDYYFIEQIAEQLKVGGENDNSNSF